MTQVAIEEVDNTEIEECSIRNASFGEWYIITNYPHNPDLVGDIGVIIYTDGGHLATPKGKTYSHPDILVKPLKSVKISYTQ